MIVGLQKLPEQAESNDIKSGFVFYTVSLLKKTNKKHVSNNLFSLYFIKESVWGGLDMNYYENS